MPEPNLAAPGTTPEGAGGSAVPTAPGTATSEGSDGSAEVEARIAELEEKVAEAERKNAQLLSEKSHVEEARREVERSRSDADYLEQVRRANEIRLDPNSSPEDRIAAQNIVIEYIDQASTTRARDQQRQFDKRLQKLEAAGLAIPGPTELRSELETAADALYDTGKYASWQDALKIAVGDRALQGKWPPETKTPEPAPARPQPAVMPVMRPGTVTRSVLPATPQLPQQMTETEYLQALSGPDSARYFEARKRAASGAAGEKLTVVPG